MDKNTSILLSTLFDEVDCIIKYAFNILNCMIFKMILFVLESVLMIVLTDVTTTIYDVSDFVVK